METQELIQEAIDQMIKAIATLEKTEPQADTPEIKRSMIEAIQGMRKSAIEQAVMCDGDGFSGGYFEGKADALTSILNIAGVRTEYPDIAKERINKGFATPKDPE